MMSKYKRKDAIKFKFLSPGSEAYAVQLIHLGGQDGAEFVMTGEKDSVSQSLSDGSYSVRIKTLSGQNSLVRGHISLGPRNRTVDLSNIEINAPVKILKARPLATDRRTGQMRRASVVHKRMKNVISENKKAYLKSSQSLKKADIEAILKDEIEYKTKARSSDSAAPSIEKNVVLTQKGVKAVDINFDPQTAKRNPTPLSTIEEIDSFDGASEIHIAPHQFSIGLSQKKVGGSWQPARDGRFEVSEDQNGVLWVDVTDIDHHRHIYSRMTVSIEGLSSIRVPLPGLKEGCKVGVFPEFKYGNLDFTIRLHPKNGKMQTLLTALSNFDKKETSKVIDWVAEEIGSVKPIFAQKYSDPWAATLAAIFYAKSGEISKYVDWAYNLAKAGENISDASIVAAWARAVDLTGSIEDAEKQILGYLIQARKIGAPNFVHTNSMALDLLDSLVQTAQDKSVRSRAASEKKKRAKRSRHKVFAGPIFMWEEPKNHLRTGILPSERYNIIKTGLLKGTSWGET